MSDDDDEYEEKKFTVYLDFESYISPEELANPGLDLKIIGIDDDHPVVQINGKLFKGTYDFCVGTYLFFEEDPNPPAVDPLFDITPNQFFRLYSKTQKLMKMERIYVEKLRTSGKQADCDMIAELKIRKQPNMTYAEALNLLLPEGETPPRTISNEELPQVASLPDEDFKQYENMDDKQDDEMSDAGNVSIKVEKS